MTQAGRQSDGSGGAPTPEVAGQARVTLAHESIEPDDPRWEGFAAAKIMIVDDEPTTIDVLEVFLQGEGYSNFVTTSDSREAFALAGVEDPDVLLLDLKMPHVGGLEVLQRIRRDPVLRHVPVIILTSSTDAHTKLQALELGATDFLGKPVDPSELALRLRNTLAAKQFRDRLAYCDNLTGLPNRRLFLTRLGQTLREMEAGRDECALLHLDIDRFRQINQTLGHAAGDALLKAVAVRLEQSIRSVDRQEIQGAAAAATPLFRVGGDEFSIILPGVGAVERASRVARQILSSLADPVRIEGRDLFISSSIGISLYPTDGEDVGQVLANANVALSHAKKSGMNGYQFYSRGLNVESAELLSLENDLRKAVERKELALHYQPKVEIRTGRIMGVEALMRWEHPELGMVPPDRFIPIAEESGLITSLGEWALHEGCRQSREWEDAGLPPIRTAVNVSARQFQPGNVLDVVRGALEEAAIAADRLVIEVTETLIMDNPTEGSRTLQQMQALGTKISVDDFGTGYSSLVTLKRFPLDELKIDRSFIQGVPDDPDDAAIVVAIIAMAHALGLTVVAEGVETEEQLAFLRECGCDAYQGFLFSRPTPARELIHLLEWSAKADRSAPAPVPRPKR